MYTALHTMRLSAKEPLLSKKEPYIITKEPYFDNTGIFLHKRVLYLYKSALYLRKKASDYAALIKRASYFQKKIMSLQKIEENSIFFCSLL